VSDILQTGIERWSRPARRIPVLYTTIAPLAARTHAAVAVAAHQNLDQICAPSLLIMSKAGRLLDFRTAECGHDSEITGSRWIAYAYAYFKALKRRQWQRCSALFILCGFRKVGSGYALIYEHHAQLGIISSWPITQHVSIANQRNIIKGSTHERSNWNA
jgi:hypothetical protein